MRLATVGDQLLVALTNFGLTIAIGRAFGADEFAAYGIGLSVGLMVQGLQRHAVTIPLMLHPASWVRERKAAIAGEQILMLLPALLVGFLALFAASWSSGFLQLIVLSSAVCLLIYLQLEFARAFLVKLEKPGLLLAGAAFYTAVSSALAIAALRGLVGYDALLISLAVAMVVHACAVAAVGGGVALKDGSRLLAADMKRYGGWALAATGTYAGYNHAPLLILAPSRLPSTLPYLLRHVA